MRSLWLYLFPVLFLPNLGTSRATGFGTLEISDYLIVPYLFLVIYGLPKQRGLLMHRLTPVLVAFAVWVCIGTLSIPVRYPDEANYFIYFGLLKFAKLSLYVTAGVLTAKRLCDPIAMRRFHWVLLIAGIVIAIALITAPSKGEIPGSGGNLEGFKTNNAVSVMLTIIASYIAGAVVLRIGTPTWRSWALIALGCMALGSAFSSGRGGWLAAIAAMLFLLYRRGFSQHILTTAILGIMVLVPAYFLSETFHSRVKKTLAPDPRFLQTYHSGLLGIDDGERIHIWMSSVGALRDAPLWGAGFFHRSRLTHLWSNGSHNYFLQMFLETGLLGGILVLIIFWQMWRHAGTAVSRFAGFEIPLKCALVAAFVGGLGGEYFYGGMPVLSLITVYGPVGALACHRVVAWRMRTARPWASSPCLKSL